VCVCVISLIQDNKTDALNLDTVIIEYI